VGDRFSPAVSGAAFEELDSFLKLGNGNVRETARVCLIRYIFDAVAGEILPISHPNPAE
jgi:hypothetical protein